MTGVSVESSTSSSSKSNAKLAHTTTSPCTTVSTIASTMHIDAEPSTVERLSLTKSDTNNDILGAYVQEKTLRSTLQGCVSLMRRQDNSQRVAVKVSLKELVDCRRSTSGVRIAEDVVREAKLLTRLSTQPCANLVQMIEHIEDKSRHCLVMEYAEGGELFDHIEKVGSMHEDEARHLVAGIANGVAFMHARSICHLDLSLENILLSSSDSNSTPKICDLGLARVYNAGAPFRGSKSTRPGKLAYMAPEVFAGDDFHGDKADVWSLGAIMFVVLFGFPPFEVASKLDVRFQFCAKRGLRALLAEWNLRFHVSEDALDLLVAMLSPANTRITLPEVMAHPFFARHAEQIAPAVKSNATSESKFMNDKLSTTSTKEVSILSSSNQGGLVSASAPVTVLAAPSA